MPRTARAIVGGLCYHVINRGNARATVFHEPADYQAFLALMRVASEKIPMRILAYCLMPNHFHLVLWPHGDSDISRWMHWLLTTHTKKHHSKRKSSGRVWQGRFKAFPIEQDRHLLTVIRYVERNALRANLVGSAVDWEWSSASRQLPETGRPIKSEGPVTKPRNWLEIVDRPHSQQEIDALRLCVTKNRPYGTETWARSTATDLGLLSSFRGPGRPKPGHS
jgi:putative transposase